jgi:hypothetical protein
VLVAGYCRRQRDALPRRRKRRMGDKADMTFSHDMPPQNVGRLRP